MKKSCSVAVLALAVSVAAQQAPVPVEQEPHHHVELKNDSVMVMHVTIPAGESTLYHTHSHDRAAVHLTVNNLTFQLPDQPESAPDASKIGEVSASAQHEGGYTHRVHNLGPGTFEVMDVEFLQRPKEPSTAAATVVAENPSARVYNWTLAPGASSPMHTHTRPYLIVAATALQLKMKGADGKSLSGQVKPGEFHWIEAKVTHTLANEGAAEGQLVEIELK